jgi:hypothetical protein
VTAPAQPTASLRWTPPGGRSSSCGRASMHTVSHEPPRTSHMRRSEGDGEHRRASPGDRTERSAIHREIHAAPVHELPIPYPGASEGRGFPVLTRLAKWNIDCPQSSAIPRVSCKRESEADAHAAIAVSALHNSSRATPVATRVVAEQPLRLVQAAPPSRLAASSLRQGGSQRPCRTLGTR